MSCIRIILADDHTLVREGLLQLLNAQADIDVVGEATDGMEALELCRRLRPQILVLDIAMPKMTGLDVIGLIKDSVPEVEIVVLSMYQKEAYAHRAFKSGAKGYVLKASPSSHLLGAIRRVAGGEYYLSPEMRTKVIGAYLHDRREESEDTPYEQLTEREQQVFHLLIAGNSSIKIAEMLCVSPKTVEKHRAGIVKKLGISHPVEMVKYAVKLGILDPDFWQT